MLLLIYSIFFSTYYMPGPVLSQGNIFPKGHLAIPGDIFNCHTTEGGLLLASRGYRPGMLLNTLQDTGQPHDNYVAQCQVH